MGEAIEIAKGLTKAERNVLMAMSDGEHVYPASYTAADAGVPVAETVRVMRRFRAEGLAIHGPLYNEDDGLMRGSGTWLCNAGLEVRTILQSEDQ